MNEFIDWNLWVKDVFSDKVVNKYNRLIDGQNRIAKTEFFDSFYDDEFFKLNVQHLFMLKSKEDFPYQVINKVTFLALIKPILATKDKT